MSIRANTSLSRVGVATALAVGSIVATTSTGAVEAVPGETISGLVFRDDGHDGSKAGDPGDAGIEVTVIDSGGATATAVSGVGGNYSVDLAALDAGPYTVRFEIPSTITYLKPGPIGPDNRTDTRIVAAGNTTDIDFGVVNPADFCQANPDVITNCFQEGDQSGTDRVLIESTFNASGDGAAGAGQSPLSLENEIGTTFGLAVQTFFDNDSTNDLIYASALAKRFAGYGPGGPDAIYQLDRNGDPITANTFTAIDAGTDNHDFVTTNDGGDVMDSALYADIGKVGWGDIDLSEDGNTLYAVNLFDRTLYALDVSAGDAAPPTQSASWALTGLPGQTCAAGNIRPWAVGVNDGLVYVGSVCDAQGGAASDLVAHVHALDPITGTWTNIQTFPLDYEREQVAIDSTPAAAAFVSANWRPWDDVWDPSETGWTAFFGPGEYADPQPMLSDIEFLANGDIVLGLRDRYGDQAGDQAPNPQDATDTFEYRTDAAGDTLHMCLTAPGTWQIENGTTCVSNDNDGELESGPGDREYYNGDLYVTGGDVGHYEISLGGLVTIDQNSNVLATGYDTLDDGGGEFAFSQGLFRLDGASGDRTGGYRIVGSAGGFGKANGLGDIEAICDSAPLEIGNYVWFDVDSDGVQDPDEVPLQGVSVQLVDDGGTPVGAPVLTGPDGYYSFPVEPLTDYTVTFDASAATDPTGTYTIVGALLEPTDADQGGNDELDSDITDLAGVNTLSVTTGTAGDNDHSFDAGFSVPSVSVGDFVFIDVNRDGIQDGGDTPVEDATLTLTGPGGGAVTDVFGNVVPPVQTDAAGAYTFDNLPLLAAGESYTVTIDPTTAPALDGYLPTLTGQGTPATDSSTGSADSGDLVNDGDRDPTLDFGFVAPRVSVGDFVFIDENRDGIQDGGDTPVEDATLTLTGPGGGAVTDVFGNVVPPVQTDASGAYTFDDLPGLAAGESYTVTIDPSTAPALAGYVPTQTGQGTPATDSSTGSADSGDLVNDGDRDPTLDFGFVSPAVSVGDFVFIDENGDGIQDGGDTPVEDATLTLTGPGGGAVTDVFGNVVPPVQTDAAGAYTFDDLPALAAGESYTVTIDPSTAPALAGYVPTQTGQGTPATDSSTGSADSGDLVNDGDRDPTLDFGFVPGSVSVGDFVFIDVNRDGIQDGGDLPVEDATLTLTGPGGGAVTDVFGNVVPPVQTDASGAYTFANLPVLAAGESYTVTIDPSTAPTLAGFVPTLTGQGTPATDSSTGSADSGDLTVAGDRDDTLDFGFVSPSVSVGDFVFIDVNRDGIQDGGDLPVEDATLTLTGPGGGAVTDVFGNVVPPVQTDAAGAYTFDDLPVLAAGESYTVTIDPSTAPALAGYLPTLTGQGTPATDSSTGSADSGDLVNDGDRDPTLDFGFVPPIVSVGDFVFIDVNRDGIQDGGDLPVEDATLTLTGPGGGPVTDVFGNVVPPVQTDAAGAYTFDDLPALAAGESYTVTIDPSTAPALAGYVPTQTGQGTPATDSSTGSAASGDLVNDGDRDPTLDFGFVSPSVSVGDYVFIDTNGDGIQDGGDLPVEDATLTLTGPGGGAVTDVFGNPVLPVQTGPDGSYSFDDLPALPPGDSYTVTIDPSTAPALSGFVPTRTGQGTPATDSSTGSADSGDLVADGDSDDTLDFGFVPPSVSVGDFVFIDVDRDGVQDAGDTPVPGATLTLTGPDGDPVVDVFGNPVGPVQTDADGMYGFNVLPILAPGESYTVTIDPTTAPLLDGAVPTQTGQGTPATDSSTGSADSGDLTSDGDRDDTLDFGFITPSVSIGDYVFIDTNRNGIQDSGDRPVPGATLTLTGPDGDPVVDVFGNPVGPVQTDADGMYSFDDLPTLPPGESYTVTIDPSTAPALLGHLPTQTGQGTPATDSSTGSADTGDLTDDGDSDDTLDFGFVPGSVSVGDFVFIDRNRNGIQDTGDTPVPGATLTLTGPGGGAVTDIFGDPVGPTVTNSDGIYSFDNLPVLPPGQSYTVTIDPSTAPLLAGLPPTFTGRGTPATDSSSGSATTTGLTMDGDRDDTLDFGFIVPDDLLPATGGSVWNSLMMAMLAVGIGLFLVFAGRRRRQMLPLS